MALPPLPRRAALQPPTAVNDWPVGTGASLEQKNKAGQIFGITKPSLADGEQRESES